MSRNNTYYIVRHGETFATKISHDAEYGDKMLTAEILPKGIPAIKRVAKYLKDIDTDYNYTSELKRCVETAKIISEVTGKKFETNKYLNEKLEPDFQSFLTRMKKAVEEFEGVSGKTYLFCTHGAVISALKYLLLTGRYDIDNLMDFPDPGTVLVVTPKEEKLLNFNAT